MLHASVNYGDESQLAFTHPFLARTQKESRSTYKSCQKGKKLTTA